jgi:hypothetical protein
MKVRDYNSINGGAGDSGRIVGNPEFREREL